MAKVMLISYCPQLIMQHPQQALQSARTLHAFALCVWD